MNIRERISDNVLVIAYVILVLMVAIGLFRLEMQKDALEREGAERRYVLCTSINEFREDIENYLLELPPPPPIPDEIDDPVVRQYFEALAERSAQIADGAAFHGIECPPSPDDLGGAP